MFELNNFSLFVDLIFGQKIDEIDDLKLSKSPPALFFDGDSPQSGGGFITSKVRINNSSSTFLELSLGILLKQLSTSLKGLL